MDEKTRIVLILCLCLGGGAAAGYVAGATTTGLLVGFLLGLVFTGGTRSAVKWTKAQRRVVVAVALVAMIIVGVAYWWLTGDYLSGLGSTIALSFVIILKMEKLFDERVGALFAKAGRDGFIAMNLALAVLLFAIRFAYGRDPMLANISPTMWFLLSACASWFVFLVSVTYHAYVKGE